MIPLVDLKAQYVSIKSEIAEAINIVLENGEFILGREVATFEREFAAYCHTSEAIAVNSGTSALHLALLAGGVGPGDEVITVPFTFVATVAAILYTGARPVFVDINPDYYTMDVTQLEAAITERTKAILPVHLYGQSADMDPIVKIAEKKQLTIIEDAAQAHGAEYKGRAVGSIGDIGCFSFYPSKNLGAYGEGGALVTNNSRFAKTVRILRDCGQEGKYNHVLKGYNYRMEGLQGAILRVKLRHLDKWTAARRQNAVLYKRYLEGAAVTLPHEMSQSKHVYHVYSVRTPDRERLRKALDAQEIQTGIHYPKPVHLQKGYADIGYKLGDFPQSERASEEVLSLPMYAELSDEQIKTVSTAVLNFTGRTTVSTSGHSSVDV